MDKPQREERPAQDAGKGGRCGGLEEGEGSKSWRTCLGDVLLSKAVGWSSSHPAWLSEAEPSADGAEQLRARLPSSWQRLREGQAPWKATRRREPDPAGNTKQAQGRGCFANGVVLEMSVSWQGSGGVG